MRSTLCFLVLAVACVSAVAAQEPPPQERSPRRSVPPVAGQENAAPGVSPAEVQRMFDAYALMQAQEQLKIGDEQFAQFLTRYKALQDVRRRSLQQRARLIAEMRQALNRTDADEARLNEQIKALQDVDMQMAADVRKAYDAIDQVLDVRQRAKFRVFEEQMERRKLELITRARQANRPKNQK